jgi:hypothetical protein
MKAWSYWEDIDAEWRAAPPNRFPTYAQWQCDVAAVVRLSNPASTAQQVLDALRRIPESEWNALFREFSELVAFSLWLESLPKRL